MRSALECNQNADHCEGMARAASDDINRHLLYAAATMWRGLADTAGRQARIVAASYAFAPTVGEEGRD